MGNNNHRYAVHVSFDLILLSPLGVVNQKILKNFHITICWHVSQKLSHEIIAVNEGSCVKATQSSETF